MSQGIVVAVCSSEEGGVPKLEQPQITIGAYGVEGDYHYGEVTKHGSRAGEPNRRQVTLVAREAVDEAASALGVQIPVGGLGENVLLQGLGDLSAVEPGQTLRFSSGVELEVTAQNQPCRKLMVWHEQAPKQLYGKRGLLTVVKTPGVVSPGDTVTVG